MRIFWSWQSDTPGKTGRHFIRNCLKDAIAIAKGAVDVQEPSEREARESLELDQDRFGVVGHPSLSDAIFKKIAAASVFVGDVTLIAELKVEPSEDNPEGIKRLINSNVAIEYGYAVGKLTDDAILLVMNLHYGPLTTLPFDLSHKVAPCRYRLAPDASKTEIAAQKKELTGQFVEALRLHIKRVAVQVPVVAFQPTSSTTNRAFFWEPGEILVQYGHFNPLGTRRTEDEEVYQYRFDEPRALYLRLIPTVPSDALFTFGKLMNILERRRVRLMTRTFNSGTFYRNKYGAISYEASGTNYTPVALTQLHRNGEIWAVTREFWVPYAGENVVAMGNVENRLSECLDNSINVARDDLGIEPPYEVEVGIIGLRACVYRCHRHE